MRWPPPLRSMARCRGATSCGPVAGDRAAPSRGASSGGRVDAVASGEAVVAGVPRFPADDELPQLWVGLDVGRGVLVAPRLVGVETLVPGIGAGRDQGGQTA